MWMRAVQIAFVYVGTVVGAGFATGKEIVQFFTQYGAIGFVTIAASGGLFIFFRNAFNDDGRSASCPFI
ncbi:hypothetical protein LR68_03986 [Anoxybacillus sp. BCO1]|nr:hypothetical protein LR68_03986 [Anoxybacillus sp. BCO1]